MTRLQKRQEDTFSWGLNGVINTSTIPQCGDIQFIITPQRPVLPIPPYSVIAYPRDDIPSVYPLTFTGQAAPWTVVYPAGTRLLLGLVDSRGNSGGLSKSEFTVQSNGSTTACLPPAKTSSITMAIDLFISLSTCGTLPLQIGGGQKPYTVTLAPFGAASAINVTMGANDDTLQWVNTVPPNTNFLVAVSDSKGEYSASRVLFTSGSTNTSCPNKTRSFNSSGQTSNGNINNTSSATTATTATNTATNIATNAASNTASNTNYSTPPVINGSNNNNSANNGVTFAIVSGAVGAVGVVLLLGLLFVLFRRRNLGRGRSHKPAPDDPTLIPFDHPATGTPMLQKYEPSKPSAHPGASSSTANSYQRNPPRSSDAPYLGTTGATAPQTSGYGDAPRQPANRAQNSAAPRGEESEIVGQNTNSAGREVTEARQARDVPVSRSMSNGSRVFQGTDAGDIMEPPPAYGDLSNIPTHLTSALP